MWPQDQSKWACNESRRNTSRLDVHGTAGTGSCSGWGARRGSSRTSRRIRYDRADACSGRTQRDDRWCYSNHSFRNCCRVGRWIAYSQLGRTEQENRGEESKEEPHFCDMKLCDTRNTFQIVCLSMDPYSEYVGQYSLPQRDKASGRKYQSKRVVDCDS